jgi:uncharacterized glyoxalase superfamily protein PhnB
MKTSPIPTGHNRVCPYLVVSDPKVVIDFVQSTFDGKTLFSMAGPGGLIMHAEIKIQDSIVMVGGTPDASKAMPSQVHCYVEDVDAVYARALKAGATSLRAPTDMFYGDRISMVKDPAGVTWAISTHKEDVTEAEMQKRMAAMKG